MATLTVAQVVPAGVVVTLVAAAGGGDVFPNAGNEWFEVNNASGGSITVTFTPAATYQGLTITPLAVAVGAGVRKNIGPFDPGIFNNSTGVVSVTYSGVTTLTVGVFKM